MKYKPCLSFWTRQKNIVEFTDLTRIIYWQAKIVKNRWRSGEQLSIIFLFMSVLNTLHFKYWLCVLTLAKHNAYFIDQICTIYRPKKSLKWHKQLKQNFPKIAILEGLKCKLMLKVLDISEICYLIQKPNSYNLLTDKVAEKVPWTIYRPDEKS